MGFSLNFYAFEEQQIDDIFESQEDVIEMIHADDYKESYTLDAWSGLLELLLGIEFSTEKFRPSNIDENDEDFEIGHLFECAEVVEEMEYFETGMFFDVGAVSETNYSLNTITKDDMRKRFESDICQNDHYCYECIVFEEVWEVFTQLRSFFNKVTEKELVVVCGVGG